MVDLPLGDSAVGAPAADPAPPAAGFATLRATCIPAAGATLGVAVLGAAFTLPGSREQGVAAAMLLGGLVQLSGALTAWATIR